MADVLKRDMTYTSVTTWQAERYHIDIHYGVFGTVSEAAAMGRSGILKVFLGGRVMWVDLADGSRAPVREDAISVSRLRPEATGRIGLTVEDFENVEMTIEDMHRDPDMCRGFGSLAYGVVDADGQKVALPLVEGK